MSEHAATPTGAAEGAQPTDRPILRPSRQEAIEAIQRKRIDDFNAEQKRAGSDELVEHTPELGRKTDGEEEDAEDVDQEDRAAEEEKKRLEAEAREQEARDRDRDRDRDSKKAGKAELEKQLAEDDRVTVIDDPSKYRVKGKVDGEEVEVSLTDAVRAVQKEKAADRRMEEAAKLTKEAHEKMRLADEEVSKAKSERDAKATKEAEDARAKARAGLADTARKHAELLYEGKTEEAAKIMQDLLEPVYERPTPTQEKAPAVDVTAITKQVTEAVSKRLKTEGALDAFAKDYPEIIANERLSNMADSFYDAAVKDGKSHEDALKHAGIATRQEVRELAKSLGMSEAKPKTTDGRESREKRKGEIDEVEAASGARSLRDTDPEPGNARSVIAEMARTRPGAAAAAAAEKARSGG